MKERGWIEPIVERVVGEVFESQAAQLRTEIVRRVLEEIAASGLNEKEELTSAGLAGDHPASVDLAHAVAEIQLGTSQREILRALLDTSAQYATRVALFVVKGGHATGWQGRGFTNNDALKDFALDQDAPAVIRAIDRAVGDREGENVPVADLDSRFLEEFRTPLSGEARIFPLILKDKVAALVYADSGTDAAGLLDAGSLELLVLSTGAWLEVNSLRKHAHKEPSATHGEDHSTAGVDVPTNPAPAQSAPSFDDPFTSHTPRFAGYAKAATASAGDSTASASSADVEAPVMAGSRAIAEPQFAAWERPSSIAEMEPTTDAPLTTVPDRTTSESEAESVPSLSPEDRDIHSKAQRFARLLVDEIKLYNQPAVTQGRQKKDLYDRLQEVIEKSRATYQKRYGNTVAGPANYFEREIIRSLAEDDPSRMGPNFRR